MASKEETGMLHGMLHTRRGCKGLNKRVEAQSRCFISQSLPPCLGRLDP